MNELDYKIFKEKGILIVPGSGVSSEKLTMALKVELARNFGVCLKDSDEISDEFVMEFFWRLSKREELKSQPYFPIILPVNRDGVDVGDLLNRPSTAIVISRASYISSILSSKNPDQLELEWISGEIYDGPTKLLTKFLSVFLKKGKIRAGRVERKRFMDALERISDDASVYKTDLLDLWKKVALWIHPSEYPEYPHAQSYLFWKLRSPDKKEPEKPKLRKLMWKGWEEGKDFDVFESYIDQPRITVKDILISIRDYERCPRVSRWKRTEGVEIGKEKTGQEETEVVDLILLQLKEKLLGMLKPKKANLKIPPSFYKVPAHSILKHPLVIADSPIDDAVTSFKITATAPKYVYILTYDLKGNEQCIKEWKDLDQDFLIVGYQVGGWHKTSLVVSFYDASGNAIEKGKIKVSEEVRSLVLFGYNSSTRTLRWLGEPSKTFYAGIPSKIKDWKNVWNVVMGRKPILSLGEMAEKMYDNPEKPTEELTAERIRIDLGL